MVEKVCKKNLFLFIGLFYPGGEPISLHLLRCDPFAVDYHSYMGHASHLQQPRFVNKSSLVRCLKYIRQGLSCQINRNRPPSREIGLL